MDEQKFVAYLKRQFPFRHGLGIGDDASVVRSNGHFQLVSCDILIEDVHFRLQDISPRHLALKALAVNVSDIAAMGGRAQYFYLGLGFPGRLSGRDLHHFFAGLRQGCRAWGVELAGGDYSRAEKMSIAITIIGQCQRPVLRSGARPDDLIAITGPTGESALGLKQLLAGATHSPFIRAHQKPQPLCAQGLLLSAYASAMIDVSDGLLLDLSRLLAASGTGAEIDYGKIPVSPSFRRACRRQRCCEKELVLSGGEDYQLLFAVSPNRESRLRRTKMAYHVIGRVTAGRRLLVRKDGRPLQVAVFGFDHFRENPAGMK